MRFFSSFVVFSTVTCIKNIMLLEEEILSIRKGDINDMSVKKTKKFLVFQTSEELFIIPIADILTIEKLEYYKHHYKYKGKTVASEKREPLKKVNAFPHYIEGVMSYKDNLIPIVEFELFFNNKKMNRHDENKIIILKGNKYDYGLLVDNVLAIMEFNTRNIKKMYEEIPLHLIEQNKEVYLYPDMEQIIWNPELLGVFEKLKERHKEIN